MLGATFRLTMSDLTFDPQCRPHRGQVAASATAITPIIEAESSSAISSSKGFSLPFDPLCVLDGVYGWRWWALGAGLVSAFLAGLFAFQHFETHHVAVAQLIKQSASNSLRQSEDGDPYQPHEMTIPTMIALMRSSTVIEKAVARLDSKISEGLLRSGLTITPERNTDIIKVAMNSDINAPTSLAALEAYVAEVLNVSRAVQQADAEDIYRLLDSQIAQAEKELLSIDEEILAFSKREAMVDPDKQTDALLGELANYGLKYEGLRLEHETLDLKIHSIEKELAKVSPAAAKLQKAREALAQLQLRYTNEHPLVIEATEGVRALEAEVETESPRLDSPPKPGESTIAESLYLELVRYKGEKQVLGEQLHKLAVLRAGLNEKLEQLPRKAMELVRIRSRRTAAEASRNLLTARQREAAVVKENAHGSFRLLSMAREQDVIIEKPTKKVVLVVAGGFASGFGFVALAAALWVVKDNRLKTKSDLRRASGLPVIAVLPDGTANGDAAAEWAFQTWTHLHPALAAGSEGAIICGLLGGGESQMARLLGGAALRRGATVILVSETAGPSSIPLDSAVRLPDHVLSHLNTLDQPVLDLHMGSEWMWTGEQRHLWQVATAKWCAAPSVVVLVELNEPRKPETLLVAERLPNLLWVGRGSMPMQNLAKQIALYHAAGCRLVGALLDRAPKFRLPILNQMAGMAMLLCTAWPVHAGEPVRLGAGDIVNITVIGQPELERKGTTIAPDGTVTYLQARQVSAAGNTIDQLRTALNQELRRYYKNALVSITPNVFQSRKVYVLGKVVKKGAVNLDRPMSVLEVVAEAGGLETGLFQQNTVELADLGRSFLMRGPSRVPMDMEALFMRGDMTQNVQVEAGDYLYFPSANSNEIYVLGNVKMQGTQGLLAHTSVHSAIAQAGGFTPKAYARRVLVVRGSLERPATFVVDMDSIMKARTLGFRLEPRDIVFVADKPWARAEELLSFALNAFFQGAVSSWAGANIGPMIKEAILPSLE